MKTALIILVGGAKAAVGIILLGFLLAVGFALGKALILWLAHKFKLKYFVSV